MRSLTILVLVLFSSPALLFGQQTCQPQGVWFLESGTADGESYPEGWRQMKIITKEHFAFVGELERGVTDLVSVADSLQAFRTMFSGGGTYSVQGDIYTEHLEYFRDPAYIGQSVSFNCRVEGDVFYQTGMLPLIRSGETVREIKLEEVWKRVEHI